MVKDTIYDADSSLVESFDTLGCKFSSLTSLKMFNFYQLLFNILPNYCWNRKYFITISILEYFILFSEYGTEMFIETSAFSVPFLVI